MDVIEPVDTADDAYGEEFTAELAAGWLAELRHDPAKAIWGMQLTLSELQDRQQQWLADLAMSMSEYRGRAEPEVRVPGGAYCDHCGRANPADLDMSNPDELPDRPCRCHGMVVRHCKDTEACAARREERYPPDLARVPGWIFDQQARISAEQAAGPMVRAAVAAAAHEYYFQLSGLAEDEAQQLELSGPGAGRDSSGRFVPVVPVPVSQAQFDRANWHGTIRASGHGGYMGHAISGGAQAFYGTREQRMAAIRAAQALQAGQVSDGADGSQDGRCGASPAARPPERELNAQGLYQAARGKGAPGADMPMGQAEAAAPGPQRPRTYRDRYSRRRVRRGRR